MVSGLWTEAYNITFALRCMRDTDYQIYMVADASGGTSAEAHKYATDHMGAHGPHVSPFLQRGAQWPTCYFSIKK